MYVYNDNLSCLFVYFAKDLVCLSFSQYFKCTIQFNNGKKHSYYSKQHVNTGETHKSEYLFV